MKNNHNFGYQCGTGLHVSRFDNITLDAYTTSSDLMYSTFGFVVNIEEQDWSLHNGQPCIHTDIRYSINELYPRYIYQSRKKENRKSLSLKACKRRVRKTHNIPIGTVLNFTTDWYYKNKGHINTSYRYKVKQINRLEIQYEINDPSFAFQFTSCRRSQLLTTKLRAEGFLVRVVKDIRYQEYAIAYGYNNKIAFSSNNNSLMDWYSCGCNYILYDIYSEFDKWSNTDGLIHKDTPINDIVHMLKQPPVEVR